MKLDIEPETKLDRAEVVTDHPTAGHPMTRELVDRAASLRDVLEANATRGDAERRIPDASVEAINDAGLFRIMTPRRFRGYETDIRTHLSVTAELAKGDGSAAWVTLIATGCAWLVGLYPDAAQAEVFGPSPDTRTVGAFAPTGESRRVDGGHMINGRWPWASGVLHAQWAICGVPVAADDGGEDWGLALFPLSHVTVEDTWFTIGMRGTGSNTIVGSDLFVPHHRVLSMGSAVRGEYPTEHAGEALYRSAFWPVLALMLVGPMLGLATAALELVRAQASTKLIVGTAYERQSDSVTFQYQLAEAASKIDSAYLHAFRAADDIDRAALDARYLAYTTRARVRQDTGWAARHCREAVDILASIHGASTFAEANPLQRIWRDLHPARRHPIVTPAINHEIYGRALLGVDEHATTLV
jgi:3-hydroxy-9,10-secoandrosta-1,3,5(10)-triene-9,17-dione monooxygenase